MEPERIELSAKERERLKLLHTGPAARAQGDRGLVHQLRGPPGLANRKRKPSQLSKPEYTHHPLAPDISTLC